MFLFLKFQLLLEMPYSRNLETEADEVGLILAAKVYKQCKQESSLLCDQKSVTYMKCATHVLT